MLRGKAESSHNAHPAPRGAGYHPARASGKPRGALLEITMTGLVFMHRHWRVVSRGVGLMRWIYDDGGRALSGRKGDAGV